MARHFMLASTLAAGCAFTGQTPGEPGSAPDGGGLEPPRRCTASQPADVRLCIDFEDPSLAAHALDGSGMLNDAIATNVKPLARSSEQAALLTEQSSLHVAETSALDLATLTIEMWVRPDALPGKNDAFGLLDNDGRYSMQLSPGGRVRCAVDGSSPSDARDPLSVGAWHHVACRYDGSEMRIYVDGDVSDCSRLDRAASVPTAGTAIGARIAPLIGSVILFRDHFVGGLDNVRVYNGAIEEARLCAAAGRSSCRTSCPSGEGGHDGPGGD